ncbi:hypothetical protein [Pseudomonas syringae group genomosp. 3]|nr:hypothetical protein [Pseudomonas syringae group genomosp. 3]KPC10962.1 Unknown protein sequence [Pseudomonas syringae pv. maculicola]
MPTNKEKAGAPEEEVECASLAAELCAINAGSIQSTSITAEK